MLLWQNFRSFFQAKRFFNKPFSFLLFIICLLSLAVALTACYSREDRASNVEKSEQYATPAFAFQDVNPILQNVASQPEGKVLSDNVLMFETIDDTDMIVDSDDSDDELAIDPEKTINHQHLHDMLEHYAVNQFLPNGEESQDFQQAYLASIYTMRHDSADINPDDSPDVAFIKSMIFHRQGVISLANLQLRYGEDANLQYFAQDMIASQENEIWLMTHWLKEVYPNLPKNDKKLATNYKNIEQEYHNSLNQMHEQMLVGALQDDADMAFIQTMLPLLKGGLALAQVALKYGHEPKVQNIANQIIMNQVPEIQALQKWKKEHR